MFDDYDKDYFYEIYVEKNPANAVLSKIKLFSAYEISKAEHSLRNITYFDTPNNYLGMVNILLSTDIIDGEGELTLERNLENDENRKYIKMLQTYKHSTPYKFGQQIQEFIPFLRDSLRTFFSTPLDFDADNLFKKCEPTYSINIKNESYKIVSFSGFKCWVTIENTTFTNLSNGRKNYVTYVKITKSDDSKEDDMQDFITKFEKYCKCVYRIDKSKYSECVRLTRDIDVIIAKKKKAIKMGKKFDENEQEDDQGANK